MDPRPQAEEEQFLMDMAAEGGGQEGNADEQVDDGSNMDIYLNMSGDRCEPPSRDDDLAADQHANVCVTTALHVFKSYLHLVLTWIQYICMYFYCRQDHRRSRKNEKRPNKDIGRALHYKRSSSRW